MVSLGLLIGAPVIGAPTLITPTTQSATVKLIIPNRSQSSQSAKFDWNSVFKVYLDNANCCAQTMPIQGTYTLSADVIEFQPDFPFSNGISYRVKVDMTTIKSMENSSLFKIPLPQSKNRFFDKTFSIPKIANLSETVVTQIYPSGEQLPENLLRFYIYFSNPMQRGAALKYIKLLDDQGNEVKKVFLQYKQELWSPDQKRLTLPFEPGRIKRGVSQNLRLGSALQEGQYYKLVINRNWLDAEGNKLKQNFEKTFKVTNPIRTAADPKQWKLHPPLPLSLEKLSIELLRPYDHALLKQLIRIRNADGQDVDGTITLAQAESLWLFNPIIPWGRGAYSVQIDATLEDVAGNNLNGPLDRDLKISSQTEIKEGYIQVSFNLDLYPKE